MDVLEKLDRMAVLPQGSEMPEWLSKEQLNWDVPLRELFHDAAEEIRRLRSTSGEQRGYRPFVGMMGDKW